MRLGILDRSSKDFSDFGVCVCRFSRWEWMRERGTLGEWSSTAKSAVDEPSRRAIGVCLGAGGCSGVVVVGDFAFEWKPVFGVEYVCMGRV